MEEIDIIELLKRVRGGNAPEKIEINDVTYEIVPNAYVRPIKNMYMVKDSNFKAYWEIVNLDTKIKILDEPKSSHIIKEIDTEYGEIALSLNDYAQSNAILKLINKVNEIIKHINKEIKE